MVVSNKIQIYQGLTVGLVNLCLGVTLSIVLRILIPSLDLEFQNIEMFRLWDDPLQIFFLLYPFILGLVMSYLWVNTEKLFSGNNLSKAFQFARFYFVIATLPGMFISYASFQVSLIMIIYWTVAGFMQAYVAGLVFTKAIK